MKFSKENAVRFGWNGIQGWALSSSADFPRASVAYFEVNGSHGSVKSTLSDRIYYVLAGEGKFIIDGQDFSVLEGEVVIVPKDTFYDYVGEMKLLLVHAPAFDSKSEVWMEGDN